MLLVILSDKRGSLKGRAKEFAGVAQHCRVCDEQEAAVEAVKENVHTGLEVLDSWHSSRAALPRTELEPELGTERGNGLHCLEMMMQREAAGGGSLTASTVKVTVRLTQHPTSEQDPRASSGLTRMIGKASGFSSSGK